LSFLRRKKKNGKVDQAIAELKRAIELNPNFAMGHYNLGNAYASKDLVDQAIGEYKLAIELDPSVRAGQYEEEIKCYDKAIKINPKNAEAWHLKGHVLGQIGKYEDAGKCFERARLLNALKGQKELSLVPLDVWFQLRELHYERFLGKSSGEIQHDITDTIPHIDVYEFLPDEKRGRDFSTIITSGMSSVVQRLPKTLSEKDAGRIELMWYVRKPQLWMFHCPIYLAKYPYHNKTFFWNLTTFENSDGSWFPNTFPDSKLQHIIFLPPVFEEKGFREGPVLREVWGERMIPVHFLWLFPITYEEMKYKREKGSDAFADLIAEKEPPRVFDPYRKSMV